MERERERFFCFFSESGRMADNVIKGDISIKSNFKACKTSDFQAFALIRPFLLYFTVFIKYREKGGGGGGGGGHIGRHFTVS